jgi:hypothetical protein
MCENSPLGRPFPHSEHHSRTLLASHALVYGASQSHARASPWAEVWMLQSMSKENPDLCRLRSNFGVLPTTPSFFRSAPPLDNREHPLGASALGERGTTISGYTGRKPITTRPCNVAMDCAKHTHQKSHTKIFCDVCPHFLIFLQPLSPCARLYAPICLRRIQYVLSEA